MARDDHTYGFSRRTAEALRDSVVDGATVVAGRGPRATKSHTLLFQTPGGGIPARSSTTAGAADCTPVTLSGTTLTTGSGTVSVKNIWAIAIPPSEYIVAHKIGTDYVAVHPFVMDVRWVSPNLQQTKTGTYTNIDTAEDCT